MGQVFESTYIENCQYLLSQTPPNFVEENYYLKELQDKVDADWRFRPNRKWIEEEKVHGAEEYTPIEVVVQSVKSDKGEVVSDDWYKLVFRDCSRKNKIGNRYRFAYDFCSDSKDKSIWIGLNQKTLEPTSSQVICRCNGSIGSIFVNEDGTKTIHYEPVIQPSKLSNSMFRIDEVAIDPKSDMTLVAQYNKYTAQYYINQRFVIGYDTVYKINNIIKSDSLTTFNPYDIGTIKIYLDQDQVGELDNFETRIAYNGVVEEPIEEDHDGEYILRIQNPKDISEFLTEDGIIFKPQVLRGDVPQSIDVDVSCELTGANSDLVFVDDYVKLQKLEDGFYSLTRLKENIGLSVVVTCTAVSDMDLKLQFAMHLRDF